MTDLLRKIQQIQWKVLKRTAGETVTYEVGQDQISDFTAVRGQTRFSNSLSDGESAIEARTVDWLVDPADFVIDGNRVEPVIGGVIIDQDEISYEILDLGNGMAWAPADGREERMRIHTQKVMS